MLRNGGFFVRGEEKRKEKVLEQLNEQWNSVAMQTAWKLEPLQCFLTDAHTNPEASIRAVQNPDNNTGAKEALQHGVETMNSTSHSLNLLQSTASQPCNNAPINGASNNTGGEVF